MWWISLWRFELLWSLKGKEENCGIETKKMGNTFECRVEEEAPTPHQCVAHVADQEDSIMPVLSAASNADVGQIDEEQICQCVDDLGSVMGGIVVL